MAKAKKPKLDFDPFMDEMYRRMDDGIAKPSVTLEAQELEKWARREQYCTPYGKYLEWETIRDRIRRRIQGGAKGYLATYEWKLGELLARLRKAAVQCPRCGGKE
jgi:hypothetical protein